MSHDYASRLRSAAEQAEVRGLAGLVVAPGPDLLYLIGYDPPPLERLTALVVRPGTEAVLVVPVLERARAAAGVAHGLIEMQSWPDGEDPYEVVRSIVSPSGRYGVSDRMWGIHLLGLQGTLGNAEFSSASPVLTPLRARKDDAEIDLLRRAAHAADETFRRVTAEPLEGRPEQDVAGSLARELVHAGHDTAAFTIVGSGPNGASPHHEPGQRIIRDDDPVVLDFGGRLGGYYSDITRTVSVGEPSAEVRRVHEIVHEAQEAAFQAVRPGVPAEEVDRAARKVIAGAGYGEAFIHRTGHGIGLEEHEEPYLVEGSTDPLEPGMTFSIEPGIYLEGRFGVRIEDIVAMRADGAVRLNEAPRELTVVH